MPPDWTYDGYTPSVPDQWTTPPDIQYNVTMPNYWPVIWDGRPGFLNDGIGAYLPTAAALTKRMGNLRNDTMTKEFYALII